MPGTSRNKTTQKQSEETHFMNTNEKKSYGASSQGTSAASDGNIEGHPSVRSGDDASSVEKSKLRNDAKNAVKDKDIAGFQTSLNELKYDCLFYAIDGEFVDGVKVALKQEDIQHAVIRDFSPDFAYGTTPMILAAIKNNHEILKILYQNGHELKKTSTLKSKDNQAKDFEDISECKLTWKAKASPAYIKLICENYREEVKKRENIKGEKRKIPKNALEYCIQQIEDLRENARFKHELSDFYRELKNDFEELMCSLLDQVMTQGEQDLVFSPSFQEKRLELLNIGTRLHLAKFVTHLNCQLALKSEALKKCNIFGVPLLFVFHFFFDIAIIVLSIINTVRKTYASQYLGAPPTGWEVAITVWVVDSLFQEIFKCCKRGWRSYLKDWWTYWNWLMLALFIACICLRIMDFCFHGNGGIVPVQDRIMRLNWNNNNKRLISSALLGWAFVFLSLRLLRYVKVIPVLGVLQVSLGRMIVNVLQFIVIFIIVLLPFGLGMNEVFWYYKTPEVKEALCTDSADNDFCTETYFGSLPVTLKGLFWALFGYVDPYQLALDDSPPFTLWMANLLLGVYCVVAIIIMLNMLIAMMSKSFEDTSENAEIEWKFSKTVTWLRFIRGEVGVLPPFNMICLPWWCIKICKRKCASKASASYQQMPEEEDPEETKKKKEKEDRNVLMNKLFDRYTKVNVPCS